MSTLPIRSMTGFGSAEAVAGSSRVRIEIRTVNHRYLKVQSHLPAGLEALQPAFERWIRSEVARGHVSLTLSLEPADTEGDWTVPVQMDRARAYRDALRRLQDQLGLGGSVDVALLAGFRDIFQPTEREPVPDALSEEDVEPVLRAALTRLGAMRVEEGQRLASDLESRLGAMEDQLVRIRDAAPRRLLAERDRLRERIQELLGADIPVDEERIAREVAHLADRWDIHEELVRLSSHIQMFRETLESGAADGVGKRFGFIAQEMLREVNTIGSKANDAEIAARVVTLKEEVERLREQLENVE
ncbi:MAG: YicC family protein [Gemmatimonadales bacterium]|nr:MAG: YicC family protein [Gemmatimonadales bacterium]